MATLERLWKMKDEIIDDVYKQIDEAESERQAEYRAAVCIQAWFKKVRVKAYLRHLNKCAVAIQRRWRGFLGRRYYRQMLKDAVFVMKLNHYNNMATEIQKMWRGYYVRKYVANYYSRKRYLEALVVKNEIVRNELAEHADQLAHEKQVKEETVGVEKLQEYASKNHFLLSTQVIPGIYNSPFKPYPDEMEILLYSAKPRPPSTKKPNSVFDPSCSKYDLPQIDPLPPIQPKPQGPFRNPHQVQKQRYKSFQPSLRVATSFLSVEEAREKMKQQEWVTRINSNKFQPFTTKCVPYDPLLHTTSVYGHLPYGTKYFRQEYTDHFIVPKNLRTVVPPIPIFDKLNNTYSQGQV